MDEGVSPRVAPFADLRALGGLLQRAGFALPVTDTDRLIVRYADPLALMHDLRRMGATNVLVERSRPPLPRRTLARMLEIYGSRFVDPDGRVRATFEIVWLSGWAPDDSQQHDQQLAHEQQQAGDVPRPRKLAADLRREEDEQRANRGAGAEVRQALARGDTTGVVVRQS